MREGNGPRSNWKLVTDERNFSFFSKAPIVVGDHLVKIAGKVTSANKLEFAADLSCVRSSILPKISTKYFHGFAMTAVGKNKLLITGGESGRAIFS